MMRKFSKKFVLFKIKPLKINILLKFQLFKITALLHVKKELFQLKEMQYQEFQIYKSHINCLRTKKMSSCHHKNTKIV